MLTAEALYHIKNMKSNREDLMLEIHQSLLRLQRLRIDVRFCWVLAHVMMYLLMKKINQDERCIPFGKGEAAVIKKEMMKKW